MIVPCSQEREGTTRPAEREVEAPRQVASAGAGRDGVGCARKSRRALPVAVRPAETPRPLAVAPLGGDVEEVHEADQARERQPGRGRGDAQVTAGALQRLLEEAAREGLLRVAVG